MSSILWQKMQKGDFYDSPCHPAQAAKRRVEGSVLTVGAIHESPVLLFGSFHCQIHCQFGCFRWCFGRGEIHRCSHPYRMRPAVNGFSPGLNNMPPACCLPHLRWGRPLRIPHPCKKKNHTVWCICQGKKDTKKHHSFRSPVRSCTELGFYSPERQQVARYCSNEHTHSVA